MSVLVSSPESTLKIFQKIGSFSSQPTTIFASQQNAHSILVLNKHAPEMEIASVTLKCIFAFATMIMLAIIVTLQLRVKLLIVAITEVASTTALAFAMTVLRATTARSTLTIALKANAVASQPALTASIRTNAPATVVISAVSVI